MQKFFQFRFVYQFPSPALEVEFPKESVIDSADITVTRINHHVYFSSFPVLRFYDGSRVAGHRMPFCPVGHASFSGVPSVHVIPPESILQNRKEFRLPNLHGFQLVIDHRTYVLLDKIQRSTPPSLSAHFSISSCSGLITI